MAPVHARAGADVVVAMAPARVEVPIEAVRAFAYTVPTDRPESDGTFEWDETTAVVVEVVAGGARGLGFSYTGEAATRVIERRLTPQLVNRDAMDVPVAWQAMVGAVRNVGLPGNRRDGDLGHRRRPLGPEGTPP